MAQSTKTIHQQEQIINYYYWLNYYANDQDATIVTACWDNGDIGQNGFALFDRTTNTVTPTGSMLINAIMGNPS